MVNDFPRILSVLRTEKKISQRKASEALKVSQALLSHYENGIREPGLTFLVRAADFYGVSCDYLLGRTMNRAMNEPTAETLPDVSLEKDNVLRGSAYAMLQKKLLVNSLALLMELTGRIGNKELTSVVSDHVSASIYKAYRYLHIGNAQNNDAVFPLRAEFFSDACDLEMKQCEIRLKSIALGLDPEGGKMENPDFPDLSHASLTQNYPAWSQSMFTLLHAVSERLEKHI